ncbi:hypothetical protein AJ79_08525 [Helicocarpus griseus UAMH5409]|uniref:DUF6987 domain-containing protein n=1 Tax=Helicocarpus griseus UAMH5409 TaxID=1447875 RepID=A0A2B7WSK2_9EURO|nr:hypothetical protein AJ79_08525 [Helicocarpus griseus UAMH5409]
MAPGPAAPRATPSPSPSTQSRKGKPSATKKTPKPEKATESPKGRSIVPPRKTPPKLKSFGSQSNNIPSRGGSSRPEPPSKAPSQQLEARDPEPEPEEFEPETDAPDTGLQGKVPQPDTEEVGKKVEDGVRGGPLDLSALKGLEVGDGGKIYGKDGKALGRVVEGDPDDLVGQVVGDDGEIVDEDGDAIGRVEILPEEEREQLENGVGQAEEKVNGASGSAPVDLGSIKGLQVGDGGEIKNSFGNVVAKVVEGDPEDLVGYALNDQGEVVDEDGDAIGRVELVPQEGEGVDGEQADVVDGGGDEQEKQVNGDIDQATAGTTNSPPASDVGSKVPTFQAGPKIPDVPDLSKLAGLTMNDKGEVVDDSGNVLAKLQEGKLEEAVGNEITERGLVVDDDGNIKGKVALVENIAEDAAGDAEANLPPLSIMEGMKCNKQGKIVDQDGKPIGELVEGNVKAIWKYGAQLDSEGQFWDNRGRVIGKAKTIPQEEEEEETPFAGLEGLMVVKDGWVEDETENRVGKIVEGDTKKLVGRAVDEDGDILDKRGNVVGHAERYEEEPEPEKEDLSSLKGLSPNKQGNVMGPDGIPIARVVDGNPKELTGKKIDEEGRIWNDSGKVVGQCEMIPEDERETKVEGPFAGLEGLVVVNDGLVEDENGNIVGKIEEGDPKKLRGRAVDEDGDIVDKYGNVKGHVEPYEPPEEEVQEEDLSSLAGKAINKAGNVVDENGVAFGRLVSGDPKKLAGRKVDDKGQIWGDRGQVIGKAELIPEAEREKPEGPFAGFEGLTVAKDGVIQDRSGQVVGRIVEGDERKLKGRSVDEDGDIVDRSGNVLGKAERWEPEEKKRDINPMSGRKVNKEGEVRDEDGNLIGKLTDGNLKNLIGKSIDDNGYVVDNDGNKIGECTLLENIPEEPEPEKSPEEIQAEKEEEQDRQLARKMASIVQQTLDKVGGVCKMIKEHTEKADRTPKEELDEEDLVKKVKPLIEEGSSQLQECNGALRALDPDGRIAANAKAKHGQREASPEEHHLAELLKELTSTVTTTIDEARRRIADMPHAKKKLNPLWSLLSEPLFQIIAAVGLLLSGVLGLVGKLLNGLGLGGLVNNLLGGLGITNLLTELGLGSITDSLGLGKKKK